jgi:hypothetical protein
MGSSARVDQATIAFRRVLAEANVGEQARVDALVVLSQRTVYAATWPGQNQAARTLTNSEGESALPLFTGLDVLETTATRFGWRDADGSLQFRELGAREALRHALARGVNFVVVDIGCEHSVEFAREELEPLMQLQNLRGGTGPFAATGERQAAILDAVRRSSSRPPRSSGMPANTQGPIAASDGRLGRGPLDALSRDAHASVRETQPSPPMAAAAARRRPSSQSLRAAVPSAALTADAGDAMLSSGSDSARDYGLPGLPLAPASRSSSDEVVSPATPLDASMFATPASSHASSGAGSISAGDVGAHVASGSALNQALLQASAALKHDAPRPPTAANAKVPPAGKHATGPNPLAESVSGGARRTGANPLAETAPGSPRRTGGALRQTGSNSTDAAGASAAGSPPAPQPTAAEPGMRDSTVGAQRSPVKPRDDEPTIADRGNERSLSAPRVALADEVLRGISGGLRAFPEVEWACVLSDGSEIPLIGLRVDPSFLNRVADITDAVMGAGEKHSADLQVMLLNNQELMKNARRHGKAFYPWRR